MSAAHFPAVPVMALQLAVLTEKYRRAIEADCAAASDLSSGSASLVLQEARPLAFAVAPLWVDWGQLMIEHNKLAQERLQRERPDAIRKALRAVTTRAHLFTTRCVHWALFDQSKHPVPFHVADAFVAWEGARRAAWQMREQIDEFLADAHSSDTPQSLVDIAAQSQRNADRLLLQAVAFLEGREDGGGCAGAFAD